MTPDPTVVWTLVVAIFIEGVWLSGLTYLMWKRHLAQAGEAAEPMSDATA